MCVCQNQQKNSFKKIDAQCVKQTLRGNERRWETVKNAN